MQQLSSRYTRTSRSFTLTSLGCLVSVYRPCWCNPGSGSTPRIYRRPVPESARGMQQFLTDSPWDDDAAVGRLQEYLRPNWSILRGYGCGRQRLCQAEEEVGGSGETVLWEAGRGETEVPVEDGTGVGDAGAGGMGRRRRRLRDVARASRRGRWSPSGPLPVYRGQCGPPKPRLVAGQRRTMGEHSNALPEDTWREIRVAKGSQGLRRYEFSAQRVRPTSQCYL